MKTTTNLWMQIVGGFILAAVLVGTFNKFVSAGNSEGRIVNQVEVYADGKKILTIDGGENIFHDVGLGALMFRPLSIPLPRHTDTITIIRKEKFGKGLEPIRIAFFGNLYGDHPSFEKDLIKINGKRVGLSIAVKDAAGHRITQLKFYQEELSDDEFSQVSTSWND